MHWFAPLQIEEGCRLADRTLAVSVLVTWVRIPLSRVPINIIGSNCDGRTLHDAYPVSSFGQIDAGSIPVDLISNARVVKR